MSRRAGARHYRPSEIADKIEQAADLLEQTGWCREKFVNPSGHHCLAGAVYAVTGSKFTTTDYGDLTRICCETMVALNCASIHDYGEHSVVWNDEPGNEKRKVLRFMRRTARRLRNHELVRSSPYTWQVTS